MKTAINTRTQEEYDALMRYYEGISITWCFSTPATENNIWEQFKEQTCVTVGSFFPNVMEFDNIDYYKSNGYEIIPYTEFAKANITESPNYEERYREAVYVIKELSFAAQITGGTAGRDENLVKAIDRAHEFLKNHKDGE